MNVREKGDGGKSCKLTVDAFQLIGIRGRNDIPDRRGILYFKTKVKCDTNVMSIVE